MAEESLTITGDVVENLPNTLFRVKVTDSRYLLKAKVGSNEEKEERIIICYLSGKMRRNYIKILPGDKVLFEMTPYDSGRGRIIKRFNQ